MKKLYEKRSKITNRNFAEGAHLSNKKCENSTMFGFGQVDMFLSWRDLLAQKQSPKQSITSYLADPHHTVLIIYLKIS
jgi:hypothetical protein